MEQENRERLITLEARMVSERERTDYHLSGLSGRLSKLENRPSAIEKVGNSPLLKIFLAVGVTLLGFLITGDLRSALRLGGLNVP